MFIEKYEYQNIVDRLMTILGKNINIMDANGIIIASGDITRIASFHKGAKEASILNKEIIIDESNIELFNGCKPGVNIPFYYNGTVQGIVGITGAPFEVKGYGLIVKELVELMISENERKKEELFQKRAIKNFAKELIKISDLECLEQLHSRASLVGFIDAIKRIVIVGEIINFSTITKSFGEESEVKAQMLKQDVVDFITDFTCCKEDIVINIFEHRFIILKSFDRDINDYCINLHTLLKTKLNILMCFSFGTECYSLKDYNKSYEFASSLLNIGKKLNMKNIIFNKEEYYLELLLNSIPKDKILFTTDLFNITNKIENEELNTLNNTLKALVNSNMNIKLASESLFIHRNTLLYRINKFKDYGIDLMNLNTCFKLLILDTLKKI